MDIKPTLAEVTDKLKTLGSAEQIALFLEGQEITGHPRRAQRCVIAEYVKAQTGHEYVSVGDESACVGDFLSHAGGPREVDIIAEERYPNSEISVFVANFDRGEYPNLIEERN